MIDFSKITDVELDGIDHKDAPDYCDAFVYSAEYKGRKATEAELDAINDDSEFVYEQVIKQMQ